jgi:hypothetical protein
MKSEQSFTGLTGDIANMAKLDVKEGRCACSLWAGRHRRTGATNPARLTNSQRRLCGRPD